MGKVPTTEADAIRQVLEELTRWNAENAPSESGEVIENVLPGHPLHAAVVTLEGFHGGALPPPIRHPWSCFLQAVRKQDEDLLNECNAWADDLARAIKLQLSDLRASALPAVPSGGDPENYPSVSHSDDFRSVNWFGTRYTFTSNQAACVKYLWEHWERGTPDVGEATILEAINCSQSRLSGVFQKGKHPAWKAMIVSTSKGTYRLAEPSRQENLQ